MWAHYAKRHTGFVLGFNSSHNFFNQQNAKFMPLRDVTYSKDRIKFPVGGEMTCNPAACVYFTKNEEWKYEQEWRVIAELSSASMIDNSVNPPCYMFSVPSDAIATIIFGMNYDKANRDNAVQYIRTTSHLKHITTYRAELDPKSFLMKQVEIK